MSLLSPVWLLLLLPVAALVVAYALQLRRRSAYVVRFATLPMLDKLVPRQPGWRRHLPAALLVAAFAVLSLAAARPQLSVEVPRQRATVMVAIDVSLSMMSTDVPPDRIKAASAAAQQFIEGLPSGFNVGVVAFAGSVTVLAQPTPDHQAAIDSLGALQLGQGTAIGEGVFSSLAQLKAVTAQLGGATVPSEIVLLSDGSNTFGRSVDSAAAAARQAGVPVSTIAYGTPDGTVTVEGQTVRVPVDTEALAQLAQDTGGTAYVAQSSNQLDEVYSDIRSSIGFRHEKRDVTSYAVALALLLGLGAAAGSLRWFSRLP